MAAMTAEARPTLDVIRWVYAFQSWAGGHILDAAATLSESDLRRPAMIAGGHGDGSLFETLAHITGAQETWLSRWEGNQRATLRGGADFQDFAAIQRSWLAVERRLAAFLRLVSQTHLDGTLHYFTTAGLAEAKPLGQTALHVANHATHHRAEAAVALTALGSPPSGLDLLEFMRLPKKAG
jgi:uncharacterized damage-inducible protein DinB